jgi:phosphomannomutase/phosphoglucomutase
VLNAAFKLEGSGSYHFVENFPARYIADLTKRPKLKRKLKVVCACGNGTAGAFAPQVLEAIGCEVVRLDCELDHTFPKYNPNPGRHGNAARHARRGARAPRPTWGSASMATATAAASSTNHGEEIFADKVGVMLARDMSTLHPGSTFVVDVKSTGSTAPIRCLRRTA